MEFLKSSKKRRTLLSETVYLLLNLLLALAVFVLVLVTQSPLPAIALVLLSKWRVLAVRPRFWLAHVQTNLVDLIVSISLVVLLWVAMGQIVLQVVLALLYAGWLLFIKPRSARHFMAIQAGAAIFLGTSALMAISYEWFSSIVVAGMWLIGYASAYHLLGTYEESHRSFYSLVWGFVLAEFGWLFYHWTFAYALPGFGALQLSQAALICLVISFAGERIYSSYYHNQKVRLNDVLLPVLLSVSVIFVLLLVFNTVAMGTA